MIGLATVFYAALAAAAVVWGVFAGRPNLFVLPGGSSWRLAGLGAGAGLVFGLTVVGASRLLERQRWAQDLNRFFASVLGAVSWRQAVALATLSALGEELFFRGAMQPNLGIWLTTTIFALLHLPPRAALLGWTALAWLLGLAFGWGAEQTGNLAAPILAHFVINLLNLRNVARYADPPIETPKIADDVEVEGGRKTAAVHCVSETEGCRDTHHEAGQGRGQAHETLDR